jgi:hypothetical protein
MMNDKNLKRIALKPSEVKAMFGIPEGTLANMRWAKRGPRYFKKPGGRGVFYILAEVEAWITSQPVLTVDSLPEDRQ